MKLKQNRNPLTRQGKSILTALSLVITAASCGKKSSSDDSSSSSGLTASALALNSIPDLGNAMKSTSTSLTAVTGTAALMNTLASTDTFAGVTPTCKNWDRYFFNCAVSAVNSAGTATAAQRSTLQRGEAVCRNTAETANVLREFSGGSLCYMKKMPTLTTAAVTVTKEGAGITASSYADLIKPGSAAKLVKVKPTMDGRANEDIFIDVPASTGSTVEFTLTYCTTSGTQRGKETISIDVESGKLTTTNSNVDSSESYSNKRNQTAVVYLKKGTDGIEFDLTKDRVITGESQNQGSFGSGISKFSITLDKDSYLTNMNNSIQTFTFNGASTTGKQKIWAKTLVSGENATSLRLPEMGMSMKFEQGSNTMSPSGAVEWQTDTYADTTTSALYTAAKAYTFSDSVFASDPSSPTITLTTGCSRTADVEVTFNMSSTEGKTVQAACEGDKKLQEMYQLCNNSDINSARQKMFNAQ